MLKYAWVLCILFFLIIAFQLAGNFLIIDQKPKKSDVIIVLSGGRIDRLERGVDLYKRGFAPYIIISNGDEESLYEAALKMGVPSKNILIENKARSTKDNAVFSIELMRIYKLESAIIVSSNYHMRRVKNNFECENKNIKLDFIYSSSRNNSYNPNSWWSRRDDLEITINEYLKILGNYVGIHGEKAKKALKTILSVIMLQQDNDSKHCSQRVENSF